MVVCVKMMSKGSKEALTFSIVTHVTVLMLLMSKGSKVVFVAYVHNTDTFNAMSKGSKDYVMLKKKDIHIFAHNFLNIQAIFNLEKVLES